MRRWLERTLARVDERIAAVRAADAEKARRRPMPELPQWWNEYGIGVRRAPERVHTGDCPMRSRGRPATAWNLRGAADGPRHGGVPAVPARQRTGPARHLTPTCRARVSADGIAAATRRAAAPRSAYGIHRIFSTPGGPWIGAYAPIQPTFLTCEKPRDNPAVNHFTGGISMMKSSRLRDRRGGGEQPLVTQHGPQHVDLPSGERKQRLARDGSGRIIAVCAAK